MCVWPFVDATADEIAREQAHITVIRALSGNTPFNAVRYLYDRLNIIDAKTSALLRFNAFFFAGFSVLAAILRDRTHVLPVWAQWILVAALVALVLSTAVCFVMFRLQFDHVTRLSGGLIARLPACNKAAGAACGDPASCVAVPPCPLGVICAEIRQYGNRTSPRPIEEYEDTFFRITIRRQRYLRCALFFSGLSGILFVVVTCVAAGPTVTPRIASSLVKAVTGHSLP